MRAALSAAFVLWALPAMASEPAPPIANKVFALVSAQGCALVHLTPPLEALAARLGRDRRTTRVVIDWPADPQHNLDMIGRPSAFLAALEVNAPARALPGLAGRISHDLFSVCPAQVVLVAERPLMRPARSWPLGQPSPEAKVINTVFRKTGISARDFAREWTEVHAGLSLAWRSAAALPNGRYVQNLVLAQPGTVAPEVAGIGEIEAFVPTNDTIRAGRLKTAAHAQLFSDSAKAAMFTARETILKER